MVGDWDLRPDWRRRRRRQKIRRAARREAIRAPIAMPAMLPPESFLVAELELGEPGFEEDDEDEVLVGRVAGSAITWAGAVSSKMVWETLNVLEL